MAIKKEIEVGIKYSVDSKGIEDAKQQIESLKKAGNSSSGGNTNADDQAAAAEKEAQAEERRQKKAQEAAAAIEQARRREKASLEELIIELKQYQSVLEKATQQGNHTDRLKALKNIQDLERRVAALTKAQERAAQEAEKAKQKVDALNNSSKQLDKSSQQAARGIKGMGQGALTAAYFFDDLQYGIRGIMNNIPALVMGFGGGAGLAGALSLAVLAGSKLYDWLGGASNKSKDLAKKMKEQSKEIAEAYRQSMRESYQALQEFNKEERTKTVNEEYQNYVKNITREFEYQTEELEKQIRLRREEAARQKGIDTQQAELDRVNLEVDYQEGKITKRQRDYGLMMVDQNLNQKIRQRDLSVAHDNYMDLGKQLAEVVNAKKEAESHAFDMQFGLDNLPSLQDVLGLLQQQARAQRSLADIDRKIAKTPSIDELNKQIDNLNKFGPSLLDELPNSRAYLLDQLKKKRDEQLLAARTAAQKEWDEAQSKLIGFQDLLRSGGVNLEFVYGQGADIASRFKQAQDAVDEFKKNTDAAKEKFDKLTEKAGSLGDAMASAEASIKSMEQADAIQNKIDAGKIKSFNLQRNREEAEEARRNEERINNIQKQAEKEAKKNASERQQSLIKGITLEGVPEHPTAKQTARISAARDALDEGKKRLSESISETDNEIDPSEIAGAFDAMAKVLIERGQYTKNLMNHLKSLSSAQIAKINAVEVNTQKYVDEKFAEIQKEVQQSTGRLRTGINRLAGGY